MLHKLKQIGLENIPRKILIGAFFLLPVFILPFGIFPVDFTKAGFFYIALSVSFFCFLLASLYKGCIYYPKNFVIGSLFLVTATIFLAALSSGNPRLSLVGVGYETGTFVSVLALAVVAFLVTVLFRSRESIASIYRYILVSSLI